MLVLDDTRGVSTAVSHVLALGITAILLVGLISGAGSLFQGYHSSAQSQQMEAIGSNLVSNIHAANRLSNGDSTVTLDISGPVNLAGNEYEVTLSKINDSTGKLQMKSGDSKWHGYVYTSGPNAVCVDSSLVRGGDISVVVESSSDPGIEHCVKLVSRS